MKAFSKSKVQIWPVFIKSPKHDLSSFALNSILLSRLNADKEKFKIVRVIENNNYNYCPLTKVYICHNSFNTGEETHFLFYNGSVLGSVVMKMAEDQISNWQKHIVEARVIELLKYSLSPVEIARNENPSLFIDNYSLKAGFTIHMEIEGEHLKLFAVNIYLDLSHELGRIIFKS
jgi:hypothetical protein